MPAGLVAACGTFALSLTFDARFSRTLEILVSIGTPALISTFLVAIAFESFLYYWLSLALLQNFFAGIWSTPERTYIPPWITESKSVAIVTAFVVMAPSILRFLKQRRVLQVALAGYVCALALSAAGAAGAPAAYGRNFVLPVAILILVSTQVQGWTRERKMQSALGLARFTAFVLLAGTVAEMSIGTNTWRAELRADINGALNSLSEKTNFFGLSLDRIGGIVVEPTNAGYCAAAAILVAVAAKVAIRRNYFPNTRVGYFWIPAAFTLLMSGAKSGLLMLLIACAAAVIFLRVRSTTAAFLASWVASIVIVLLYVSRVKGGAAVVRAFTDPISVVGGDSTTFHLAGLISGLRASVERPLGHGLGRGGNFNLQPDQPWIVWLGSGGESAIGAMSYQLGVIGLLTFVLVLRAFARSMGPVSGLLLAAWSSSALFAEAMFGPQVCGLIMIGAGMFSNIQNSAAATDGSL